MEELSLPHLPTPCNSVFQINKTSIQGEKRAHQKQNANQEQAALKV